MFDENKCKQLVKMSDENTCKCKQLVNDTSYKYVSEMEMDTEFMLQNISKINTFYHVEF